tara:strand:- start:8777 stop:9907 length:1131 start_codon:yes stop_codon:yes gene_type:complete
LPVWATAASKAAVKLLLGHNFEQNQIIDLPDDQEPINVFIKSGSLIDKGKFALAISQADSGLALDITNGMEIWAIVQLENEPDKEQTNVEKDMDSWLNLVAGKGVGRVLSSGKASISSFAYKLFDLNLRHLIPKGLRLRLEIVLPDGEKLAERTSNSAFGIVDGLALIGTQAQGQVSASPDQQQSVLDQLRAQCAEFNFSGKMIFVIGENGFDLALKYGLPKKSILKTGNWVGPAIVCAAELGVKELILFGYHGKLIKLAGGIFHTHHHLADARLEILTYLAILEKLPLELVHHIMNASSIEEALLLLESQDSAMVKKLWTRIAFEIEKKSNDYIKRYLAASIQIGATLFDRNRKLRWAGPIGLKHMKNFGISLGT